MLIFIAVTFTWLMGLMGYVRSGLRQHWHVYGIIRDKSVDAFTPTLGFATKVVSVTVLLFFLLIGVVFWIASLHDKPDFERQTKARRALNRASAGAPRGSARSRGAVMRIPHIVRIGALVIATTGFYALRRPDGAAEGSPASCRRRPSEADLTTAEMAKVGRQIMESKGFCLTCHTIGKTRGAPVPGSRGRRCPREDVESPG